MKILIFKPGAIGDIIMSTPLVRQLRKNFPKSTIDYLVGKKAKPILENNKNINQLISFDENIFYRKQWRDYLNLSLFIRNRKYDVIFVLNKHKLYNLTALIWGIPKRIGFDRSGEGIFLNYKVPFYGARHHIFYNLNLIAGLGVKPNYNDWMPEIFLTPKEKNFAQKFWQENKLTREKVIGICPGGGANIKNKEEIRRWPSIKYIELIEKLERENFKVILIGGASDQDIAKSILEKVNCFSLVGKTSLLEAGAIIAKCHSLICTDSGLMHLASAVNERVISIFGPTNPLEKAPLHKKSQWIWKPEVGCSPCYDLKGRFPKCKDRKCLNLISPDDILSKLEGSN